ncbi:hypothetical protein [Clostridium sp.]|uniref:hypothetical protein n=1 Tax=Clostridium sp. TaxID=1506 RepID=UPI00321708D3
MEIILLIILIACILEDTFPHCTVNFRKHNKDLFNSTLTLVILCAMNSNAKYTRDTKLKRNSSHRYDGSNRINLSTSPSNDNHTIRRKRKIVKNNSQFEKLYHNKDKSNPYENFNFTQELILYENQIFDEEQIPDEEQILYESQIHDKVHILTENQYIDEIKNIDENQLPGEVQILDDNQHLDEMQTIYKNNHSSEDKNFIEDPSMNPPTLVNYNKDSCIPEEKQDIKVNNYSKGIYDMIQDNFKGVTISVLVKAMGVITGEVVFNIKDIVALKLRNNLIVFINKNLIASFF